MNVEVAGALVRELCEALARGAFAALGRVTLGDGVTVDATRMARILLGDLQRVVRRPSDAWIDPEEVPRLHDDARRLLALAHGVGPGSDAALVLADGSVSWVRSGMQSAIQQP